LNYRNFGLVCQLNIDYKTLGMVSIFVVGRRLCLLPIEVQHFRRVWLVV